MKKLSIIVPAYNEEEVIPYFYKEINKIVDSIKLRYDYELIFVDDGSKDGTLKKLKDLRKIDSKVNIISFSRNFGKEAGILAGLAKSTGDLVVVMDADLQHEPKVILEMIKYMEEGYDVVTTLRNRKGESILRSAFSNIFYSVMKTADNIDLKRNSQDFRMMTRQVVNSILQLDEYNRFSKGLFSWVGFKTKYIYVENRKRTIGKTKWSIGGLIRYSIDGITSFSEKPLKIATAGGIIISLISIVLAMVIVVQTLYFGKDVPGYASTITAVLFIGGIQLITIGILSEYVGKIYLEIKQRPHYIIKEEILGKNKENS